MHGICSYECSFLVCFFKERERKVLSLAFLSSKKLGCSVFLKTLTLSLPRGHCMASLTELFPFTFVTSHDMLEFQQFLWNRSLKNSCFWFATALFETLPRRYENCHYKFLAGKRLNSCWIVIWRRKKKKKKKKWEKGEKQKGGEISWFRVEFETRNFLVDLLSRCRVCKVLGLFKKRQHNPVEPINNCWRETADGTRPVPQNVQPWPFLRMFNLTWLITVRIFLW